MRQFSLNSIVNTFAHMLERMGYSLVCRDHPAGLAPLGWSLHTRLIPPHSVGISPYITRFAQVLPQDLAVSGLALCLSYDLPLVATVSRTNCRRRQHPRFETTKQVQRKLTSELILLLHSPKLSYYPYYPRINVIWVKVLATCLKSSRPVYSRCFIINVARSR